MRMRSPRVPVRAFIAVAGACMALSTLTTSGVARAQRPAPPLSPGTGLIVGRTIDSAGQPLAGVVVELMAQAQGESFNRRVNTDDEGEFLFADLPRATCWLVARKAGYEEGAWERKYPQGYSGTLPLAAGERRTDITLTLWKDAAVSGVVTDDAGIALAGESVSVMRRVILAGHADLQSAQSTTTDDRGVYRIAGLAPGPYAVVFRGEQRVLSFAADDGRTAATRSMVYPSATFPATANNGELSTVTLAAGDDLRNADFHVALVPVARVSGIAMGADGPMSRVNLSLVNATSRPIPGASRSTGTGADGRFTFEPVVAGSYTLQARKEPAPPGAGGVPDQPQGVTIRTGQGTMTTFPGNQGPPARPPRRVSTDPAWWADVPVVVGDSDVTDVVVSMRSSVSITGHVEFEGAAPPPSAAVLHDSLNIVLNPLDTRTEYVQAARVDVSADGRFTVFGVTPDRYVLRATISGGGGWTLKAATIGALDAFLEPFTISTKDIDGLTLVFTDRHSRINGSVSDAAGKPVAGAAVLCFPTDRRLWTEFDRQGLRVRRLTSMDRGIYLSELPPGEYFLVATVDDPGSNWQASDRLDAFARVATRVAIAEGETRRQDLRVQQIK